MVGRVTARQEIRRYNYSDDPVIKNIQKTIELTRYFSGGSLSRRIAAFPKIVLASLYLPKASVELGVHLMNKSPAQELAAHDFKHVRETAAVSGASAVLLPLLSLGIGTLAATFNLFFGNQSRKPYALSAGLPRTMVEQAGDVLRAKEAAAQAASSAKG